ncbi:MAG: hypothetical protein KKI02_00765, partial [Planctomycetes bacterium]|nr:hypothetical protein [Planctomycetota bacterium]
IGETLTADGKRTAEGERMAAEALKDSRQLHLENFFNAIRGQAELTSPGEHAYATCVTVLRANQAVESGRRYEFQPDEFTV